MKHLLKLLLPFFVLLAACSGSDPEEVRRTIVGFGDPEGDTQFVLRAVEAEVERCMAEAGFPEWAATTADFVEETASLYFRLPVITRLDGTIVGYEPAYVSKFGEHLGEPTEGEEDSDEDRSRDVATPDVMNSARALLGDGSRSHVVAYSVPGRGEVGRDMGGCQGWGYRAVLTEAELPGFLAGQSLMGNLSGHVRHGAIRGTDEMSDWSSCMALSGFDLPNPFGVGRLAPDVEPLELAQVDAACRVQTELEEAFADALLRALSTVASDVTPALRELDRIAAAARGRLTGEPPS